ncbi:MAG: T9SS type A sorting domain-containing protein [Bacteroidetes bacterium]|nr:T9SS type A sorting domain-containing protein [Bacteroidota bacterium]MBS1939809.1 T9SS type A sorting domain-containing protein [Bacteroidota bacterium]
MQLHHSPTTRRLLFLGLLTALGTSALATTYYVGLGGSNAQNGLSPSTAWATLTYAAGASSPVGPGDTVFVKAGNYGNEQVLFAKIGTALAPVVFEGYTITPGDAPQLNYAPQDDDVLEDHLDPLLMPFYGPATRGQGLGFDFNNDVRYVEIRNFQLKNYKYGVITYEAQHVALDNITVAAVGDTLQDYSGIGIALGYNSAWPGHYNTATNCLVMNAGAEAFTVFGNGNVLTNCGAYCNQGLDDRNAATDYYFIVVGDSNTVSGCRMDRMKELAHFGHGFTIKEHGEQNLIVDCVAENTSDAFCVRHRDVKHNTFQDCEAWGSAVVVVRDGASHNLFQGMRSHEAWSGISFFDTSEDGGAQYAGRHNRIINSLFIAPDVAISNSNSFGPYTTGSPIDSNTVANCTFVDPVVFFRNWNDDVHDNALINCIIDDVGTWQNGPQDDNYAFDHCRFNAIPIAMLVGAGNSLGDPLFMDPANEDFSLAAGSPCIDAGATLSYVTTDLSGTSRPEGTGYDIGAYEFMSGMGISATLPPITIQCVPNPSSTGTFSVRGVEGIARLSIRDAAGAEVYATTITSARAQVDPGTVLAAGAYTVRIVQDGHSWAVRMLVVR